MPWAVLLAASAQRAQQAAEVGTVPSMNLLSEPEACTSVVYLAALINPPLAIEIIGHRCYIPTTQQ